MTAAADALMGIFGLKRAKQRTRKCANKACSVHFTPSQPLQVVCSWECGLIVGRERKAKAEKKAIRERKEALKPLSYWANRAQAAVNAWVRERDSLDGCISCGIRTGKMNAGHYRSRGAMPALRFNQDNLHKQCEQCNTSKSGNAIEYRIRLREKIGDMRLAWLEGPHPSPRWRKEDYLAIEAEYKEKLRVLRAAREIVGPDALVTVK